MSTTPSNLNGLYKEVYPKGIIDLLPEFAIVYDNTDLVPPAERSGSYYVQPVILQFEQGFTYMAANESLELNPASSMQMQPARLLGNQGALLAQMTVETAERATSKGADAFDSATRIQMANVIESHTKRLELSLLYGGTNNGIADSSVNADTTHTVITFTQGSWADATWGGMTNAKVSLFKTTDGSILNSNAALIITAVSTENKTLTVSGNVTDIGVIDTWLGGAGGQQAQINFYGARTAATTYKEMLGIDRILTNTGTIFDIDAAVYDLWKANTYPVSGVLTQAKVNAAIALAVGKGLMGETDLLINPKVWATLENDQAALRMYDSSYKSSEYENGAQKLTFNSQNGKINVWSHPFVKEGDGFLVPFKEIVRPGTCDVTFDIPGQPKGSIFTQLPTYLDFFYKSYSNMALLINAPCKCVKLTGITLS